MQLNTPHIIHLRGPWHLTPLDRPAQESSRGRIGCFVAEHSDAQVRECRGPIRYERQFNCPTGLSDQHRVLLRFTALVGSCQANLNDTLLGRWATQDGSMQFDITSSLSPTNRLKLIVEPENRAADFGITGDVMLEIYQALQA